MLVVVEEFDENLVMIFGARFVDAGIGVGWELDDFGWPPWIATYECPHGVTLWGGVGNESGHDGGGLREATGGEQGDAGGWSFGTGVVLKVRQAGWGGWRWKCHILNLEVVGRISAV